MKKLLNIRHGDLALIGVEKLPDGLKSSGTTVLMTGSGGNDHVVKDGTVYPVDGQPFVIGYLVANEGAVLLHPDHGVKINGSKLRHVGLDAGIYELRRQNEERHTGLMPVVD